MGGERALQLVTRGSANEFPRLFGEQLIDRFGVFPFDSFASKNDRAAIDVLAREASLAIRCLDESAKLVRVYAAVWQERCKQDRRAPNNLPARDYETAGKRLCF